jgi:hypothetical protein
MLSDADPGHIFCLANAGALSALGRLNTRLDIPNGNTKISTEGSRNLRLSSNLLTLKREHFGCCNSRIIYDRNKF